jgi:hypothetical protein
MEDLLLMEYLKGRGNEGHELVKDFKTFMNNRYRRNAYMKSAGIHIQHPMEEDVFFEDSIINTKNMPHGSYKYHNSEYDIMKDPSMGDSKHKHFDEEYARYVVSNMYHIERSRKHSGEKYDMKKANEVFSMYKAMLPEHITKYDVYVAINAQYHDYCVLFKSWFGDNIERKIIDSAITFWFKDVDAEEDKLWNYFE